MVKILSQKYRADKKTMNVISAGGVVFRKDGEEDNEILLIRRADEKIWCLPKGKIEQGEDLIDAALREIKEETELRVINANKKICEIKFKFYWPPHDRNYDKIVHYFLFLTNNNKIILEKAFDDYRWCTMDRALKLLHYDNDKYVVKKAFELR